MKSFISAVNEDEERLFRYADPKLSHVVGLAPNTDGNARPRLIEASPIVPPELLPVNVRGALGPIGSTTFAALTEPSDSVVPAFSPVRSPQHGRLFALKHWPAVSVLP